VVKEDARADARQAPGKCARCGAPVPASGECANCRSKELLAEADKRMEEATARGVEVRKVDILVRQARSSLDEGNFGESRLTADKALALLDETTGNFTKASDQIAEAQKVVEELRGRSVDVGQSDSLIQLAQSFLKTGNYEKAVAYAKKAIKTANEAQTRQATEKALEEKPPLPPAVARPVEPGSGADTKASKPVILAPAREIAAPSACPACGEPVEPGWKRCPKCTAELSASPAPARAEAAPAAAEGDAASAEAEIKAVEADLERLEKSGQNVAHARNLLKLAVSFLRGGSYEKATRYARKVKSTLEEKKSA
jgi:tetratricopeptide (TPR) repeat protein